MKVASLGDTRTLGLNQIPTSSGHKVGYNTKQISSPEFKVVTGSEFLLGFNILKPKTDNKNTC